MSQLLPPPELIPDVSFEAVRDRLVANIAEDFRVNSIPYTTLSIQADPLRRSLETYSADVTNTKIAFNDQWVLHFVRYSSGQALDELAAYYDVSRMIDEGDDRLKKRLLLHIAGRSAAGPKERYQALCMDADIRVRDVEVWRDEIDPTLHVAILSSIPGGIAPQDLLDAVEAYIDHPERMVTSERFTFSSAVKRLVNVELDVWLFEYARNSEATDLETSLPNLWDKEDLLGLDLTHAWLIDNARGNGVNNVRVVQPSDDMVALPNEAIGIGSLKVNVRGRGR
ncbi:baseplate J/gp47 family protein [Pseudovibrio ascidiaceicola]|uniref:baseplate J/gp47 family protein n=1 Tax=Pseudovibrio ascidiaceicola TaxID=285279 RepID=UPI003D35B168